MPKLTISNGTKINRNFIEEKKTISDQKNLFKELITLNVWQKPFKKVHPFWRIVTYFDEKKAFLNEMKLFLGNLTFDNHDTFFYNYNWLGFIFLRTIIIVTVQYRILKSRKEDRRGRK